MRLIVRDFRKRVHASGRKNEERIANQGKKSREKAVSEFPLIDENLLKSRIYTIRGVKVMLDAGLAEIYGYETKAFNRQVKNNIERFPEEFRFPLSRDEQENLRCKKGMRTII